ncbi:MAG: class I SAM-dependent methyltransferase [Rhodovibrionaceae bacterium]
MSPRTLAMTDEIHDYILKVSLRETETMRRLREETQAHPHANMQIAPEQGQFMALLAELIGARRCIEIGSFTGYSALAVARALPEDGKIVCCDVSEDYTAVARRYWKEAGIEDKIDLRIAPAQQTLDALIAEEQEGAYDFVFVDADKEGYDGYYERALVLLREGGLIAFDNVLWSGKVADPAKDDADTQALRTLNEKLGKDERISVSMVPIGDGLTLARKR